MTAPVEERTHWTSATGSTATLINDELPPASPLFTEVILVRHGETDWNRDGRCQGRSETSLNATGTGQAMELRRVVRAAGIVAAYTSPLTRARETAAVILGDTGPDALLVPDLCEIDYGRLSGLTPAEWESIDGGLDARWRDTPWETTFVGGESLSDVYRRTTPVWDALVATHRGERILLVGHGHVHRVLVLHAMNGDPRLFWSVPQPNGAVWHVRLPVPTAASTSSHRLGRPAR